MLRFVAAALMFAVSCGGIWVAINQIRTKHGPAVHVVWYLFSLAICVAAIAFHWARMSGAIDANGKAAGEVGKAFFALISFTLDLEMDFLGLLALVGVIVIPQFLSYLLSGAFGCASRPRLVTYCVNLFSWGMAKSCATASGVLVALSVTGYFGGWTGFDALFSAKYIVFSEMLLVFAFVALMCRATLDEIPLIARSPKLKGLRHRLSRIDTFMTRNRPDAQLLEWPIDDAGS